MLVTDYQYFTSLKYTSGYHCPHCHGDKIIRNGHRKRDKAQVYLCKDCRRTFVVTSESILRGTRKTQSTWAQYISCMAEGKTLRTTAEECGICLRTAFMWRHKILDVLAEGANKTELNGLVEAMEMYFQVSYKGKKNMTEKEKNDERLVCVPFAVNRENKAISKISGLNALKTNELEKLLHKKITKTSKLITSRKQVFSRFARQEKLKIIKIKNHKTKKGLFHNQTAQTYENQLLKFMFKFRGVATKYLNNYLIWHNFMNFSEILKDNLTKSIFKNIITNPKTITYHNLPKRPKIPLIK